MQKKCLTPSELPGDAVQSIDRFLDSEDLVYSKVWMHGALYGLTGQGYIPTREEDNRMKIWDKSSQQGRIESRT